MNREARRRMKRQSQKTQRAQAHPNSPFGRMQRFMDAFLNQPLSTEITIRPGREVTHGEDAIGIEMQGTTHAFTLNEARDLADFMERLGNDMGQTKVFANTIMGIREAVSRIKLGGKSNGA